MFKNRIDAGSMLAAKLIRYKDNSGIVLAVPRGGVPVAYIIAKELGFPLELVLTKKIGHPSNKEYAIGAASLTDYFVASPDEVTTAYVAQELIAVRHRLLAMQQKYMRNRKPTSLTGMTAIVVDDGMATGNTLLSTVQLIKKEKPANIIIAVPVASVSAVQKLRNEGVEVIALSIPPGFNSVGAYYENFNEVTDDEVVFYLDSNT
jgi:putative phosphoribosyl transferase